MTRTHSKNRSGALSIREGEPAASVLDGIDSTPLVNVEDNWAKLEFLNPSGSINAGEKMVR